MGKRRRRIKDAQSTHKEGVALAQLPQELITEFLKWLPAKSLLRFKCLSKYFCEFIGSPYFINSHLNISAQDRTHLNLIFPYTSKEIVTNYNSVKLHGSDFDIRVGAYRVCGYCNGVFLLLVNGSRPALWNPSIHQYRILPSLPGPPDGGRRGIRTWMGLGYDSSKDNYKAVVIQSFRVKPFIQYRVWIFGLRSNSLRRVCSGFPAGTSSLDAISSFGYFADGCLHWLCHTEGGGQKVVAFDMVKETFSILVVPAYFPNRQTVSYLKVLDGCLCMGFRTFRFMNEEALLYVRKKDRAEFVWSLLYSVRIDQLPPFLKLRDFDGVGVLGYSKEGDKIMLDLGLECIVSYDLKEKSFQPTDITKPTKYGARSFVESLISVQLLDDLEKEYFVI